MTENIEHIGIYRIPFEEVAKFLNLRNDHKIIGIFTDNKARMRRTIDIHIEGPEMPETGPGWVLMILPSIPKNMEE